MSIRKLASLPLLVVSVFVPILLFAQSPSAPNKGQTAVPVNVQNWAFFGHVTRLEQTASDAEKVGKRGDDIRDYYKRRLNLTDAEHSILRTVAFAGDAAVKVQDDATKALIKKLRSQFPTGSAALGASLPPAPPELLQMQVQRDAIIASYINRLKGEMGAAAFQKVDTFVTTAFAKHSVVQTLDSPGKARTLDDSPRPATAARNAPQR